MREILFRGKSVDTNKWVYGFLGSERTIITTSSLCWNTDEIVVNQDTVGQYTGLKDKCGVKIFEGDICRHKVVIDGKVMCEDVGPISLHSGTWTLTDKCGYVAIGQCDTNDLEVIGNIYDNPELLNNEERKPD